MEDFFPLSPVFVVWHGIWLEHLPGSR